MSETPIRVLVADDHAIVREGIRSVLEQGTGFEVVAEASDGEAALRILRELDVDVLVLDISMPGLSGLDVASQVRQVAPATRVLILSVYDHREYVLQAVRSGANGYLLKDSAPGELRAAIRAVHGGEAFFSPVIARQLGDAVRAEEAHREEEDRLGRLTARERDVLLLVVRGRTNKEAAAALGISHRTVESHRENLMKKLGIRTVAELTRFALDSGVLER
ncbi:MAG: response regulator transcription factor [Gemmatimonadetes bacterium]|nr:response regulator transcription factor [Gemmatimonadota bacterium]